MAPGKTTCSWVWIVGGVTGLVVGFALGMLVVRSETVSPAEHLLESPAATAPAEETAEHRPAAAGDASEAALSERPPPRATSGIDILELAAEINRTLEPEFDDAALRQALEGLAERVRQGLAEANSDEEKVEVLNRVLLSERNVTYLSNIDWRDATLAAAVLRKKGNCLATTTMYVVIGKMCGLPIRAVDFPRHVLARFEGERAINIETTAGGVNRPDSLYREESGVREDDVREFGYGRSLSDSQFAVLLLIRGASHLESMNRPWKALKLVERASGLRPSSPRAEFAHARLLYRLPGRRAEALSFYRKVASAPAGTRSRSARSDALLQLARHHHNVGGQGEALRLLRKAFSLRSATEQSAVLGLMSSCFRTQRDFSAAALAQELSLLLEPDHGALNGLAIMYKNAGRLEDAIRALRASIEMNPESWNTRLILAGYLLRAGHEDEGWKMFETVREPRASKQFFHTNMAWFNGSIGRKREFLEHLEKALAFSRTPAILNYIRTEVDFDRYRSDPDFKALVEKHRKRLLGRE